MSVESSQRPKKVAEYREGRDAADHFSGAIKRVSTVTKEELARREANYQESRADKDRPGPHPLRRSR